jgi:hypothetical protein
LDHGGRVALALGNGLFLGSFVITHALTARTLLYERLAMIVAVASVRIAATQWSSLAIGVATAAALAAGLSVEAIRLRDT